MSGRPIVRVPVLPSLLVLAAAALMVALGFWQIGRLRQKEALLARYAAAEGMSAAVAWPRNAAQAQVSLYRRSMVDCRTVLSTASIAGRNAAGGSGIAHVAQCRLPDGGEARVVLGWSPAIEPPDWRGGTVRGVVAPGPRLVADPPLAGLVANERPDPSQLPNNHLSYAVQWFAFAATALVIYGMALRRRWRERVGFAQGSQPA